MQENENNKETIEKNKNIENNKKTNTEKIKVRNPKYLISSTLLVLIGLFFVLLGIVLVSKQGNGNSNGAGILLISLGAIFLVSGVFFVLKILNSSN